MKHRLPLVLIAGGVVLALAALLADLVGLGGPGIPAMQILAAELGAVLALFGAWLHIRRKQGQAETTQETRAPLFGFGPEPIILWVLIGFLLAWLLCFILPAVFNPERQFRYFTDYIYPREHIGFDTRLVLEHIRVWYTGERAAKYLFPPLTTIFFTPLLMLRYPMDFYVVTVITLASYLILNLALPLLIKRGGSSLLILFIFGISIYSYGLQFELDTGQFYTIAMTLALLGIYIFHKHPAYRFFAYLFFTIAIQLKLTPAILVFLFVDDWRDWKTNLKRFALLGTANILLLFILGMPYFQLFYANNLGGFNTIEVEYNHSIEVFVRTLAAGTGMDELRTQAGLLQAVLYIYYLICLGLALYRAWRSEQRGIDFHLLMVCVIGAMVLPSISHDYKLPMLVAPFMLYFTGYRLPEARAWKVFSIVLVLAAAFAFSVTIFPSNARPLFLQNSFPSLFILLTAVTLLGFIPRPQEAQGVSSNE